MITTKEDDFSFSLNSNNVAAAAGVTSVLITREGNEGNTRVFTTVSHVIVNAVMTCSMIQS
jgi:hypothetical protein